MFRWVRRALTPGTITKNEAIRTPPAIIALVEDGESKTKDPPAFIALVEDDRGGGVVSGGFGLSMELTPPAPGAKVGAAVGDGVGVAVESGVGVAVVAVVDAPGLRDSITKLEVFRRRKVAKPS